jgi:N-acetylmuramoyl-L-alanine amidase
LINHSLVSLSFVRKLIVILLLPILFYACNEEDNTASAPEKKKGYWTALDKIRTKLPNARPVIILDAGHGGIDPGGLSNHDSTALNVKEKDLTLYMSEQLYKKLDKKRFNVMRIRKHDTDFHRHERTKYIELANPDLLVSLHTNWDKDTNINGFEFAYSGRILNYVDTNKNKPLGDTVNIKNPFAEQLTKYCQTLSANTKRAFPGMRNRGIKERKDRIWMLYGVHYPSLLVEFGFVTGKHDIFYYQKTSDSLDMFVNVLAKSITSFFPPPPDSVYVPPFGMMPAMEAKE